VNTSLPVLVTRLADVEHDERIVECWFYAVPRVGEFVTVREGTPRSMGNPVGTDEQGGRGEFLFEGVVVAVVWNSGDPRPTVNVR
jgi:hypothetical protein